MSFTTKPSLKTLKRLLVASGAVAATSLSLALADDTDVITVVGFRPTPVDAVASSVTVLTADDLQVRAAPYLVDQLRAVPGLGVSRSGAQGGLTQVRIRGAEANHTLVLLDGIEISDPIGGETDFGLWAGVDASRIETLRGEQSALYGSDAIGGVINITSTAAPGAFLAAEGGSRGTANARGRYGFSDAANGVTIMGSAFTTDGVDTAGRDGERDGSKSYSGVISGRRALPDGWNLSGLARFSYNEVETDAGGAVDGGLVSTDDRGEARQWTFGAALNGEAIGLDHLVRASYGTVRRETFDAFPAETIGDRIKAIYSPSKTFDLDDGSITLSGLVDFEDENYERIADPASSQEQSFQTIGVAGEAQMIFGPAALNASIRHDDNDGAFDNAVTWRVGGAFALADSLKVRASVGEGVKNPTFTELFGFFPSFFVGNPDLVPEESFSYEAGVDYGVGPVDVSVTYFNAELENEIFTQFNADFTSSPANRAGESGRDGVEFAGSWHATDWVTVTGAYSHVNSTDDGGTDEVRVPANTASLAVNWRSPDQEGLRVSIAADYVGQQRDTNFATFERVVLDRYVLLSATAAVPVTERISVTLRGENLLDETTTDVFGFFQQGAGVFAGIEIR
ncbi:MAG: TonB-dependent receptor [Pseudomonadota bacterium]